MIIYLITVIIVYLLLYIGLCIYYKYETDTIDTFEEWSYNFISVIIFISAIWPISLICGIIYLFFVYIVFNITKLIRKLMKLE